MNRKIAAVLLSGLLFACVPVQPPTASAPPPPPPAPAAQPAPADRIVGIRKATCDDLLKLSEEDRGMASMFYIGYQASRFGSSTINVGSIPKIETTAIDYCAAHPNQPVVGAFARAYATGRARR